MISEKEYYRAIERRESDKKIINLFHRQKKATLRLVGERDTDDLYVGASVSIKGKLNSKSK